MSAYLEELAKRSNQGNLPENIDLTALFKAIDFEKLLKTPELLKVLQSDKFKELMDLPELSEVKGMYMELVQRVVDAEAEYYDRFGLLFGHFLFYGIPFLLVAGLLGYLAYKLLKNQRAREQEKAEKRALRQKKKEQRQAQRAKKLK